QMEANGLALDKVFISTKAILDMIRFYSREAGVRNLEREIASVCRKVAYRIVKGEKKKISVHPKHLTDYLGPPRFRIGMAEEKDLAGVVTGLAWTEVGGDLLTIEVAIVPGKGKLTITGKLGEVMQESAQAAMTYVRSRAQILGLDRDFYQMIDIHVHVPEGAIPKDGPSAGIAIATAITSALTGRGVRRDVAMTGEVTLRGNVLAIGGLKEKLLAARRGGIKEVIIPVDNQKDIHEIPREVYEGMTITAVSHMDKVLSRALLEGILPVVAPSGVCISDGPVKDIVTAH
ncbi:endopeptidase La, partial [bacterium]|nr:endopeptidase La [bacterium]